MAYVMKLENTSMEHVAKCINLWSYHQEAIGSCLSRELARRKGAKSTAFGGMQSILSSNRTVTVETKSTCSTHMIPTTLYASGMRNIRRREEEKLRITQRCKEQRIESIGGLQRKSVADIRRSNDYRTWQRPHRKTKESKLQGFVISDGSERICTGTREARATPGRDGIFPIDRQIHC